MKLSRKDIGCLLYVYCYKNNYFSGVVQRVNKGYSQFCLHYVTNKKSMLYKF